MRIIEQSIQQRIRDGRVAEVFMMPPSWIALFA